MHTVLRTAALGAVIGVAASLALAGPVLAQSAPSPDPDPQARPDPIPAKTSQTSSTPAPAVRAPATQQTSSAVAQPTPPQSTPTRTVNAAAPKARSSHRVRHHKRPAAAPKAPARIAHPPGDRPLFAPLVTAEGDDRSRARALSLAAIALLLVVIAGGSLLRLTARVPPRGGWA